MAAIKLEAAANAAAALLGSTPEALKSVGHESAGRDEGYAFRRAIVTLLLVEMGLDRDLIREVLGFGSLSAVRGAASLVRERLDGSSGFRIQYRRMLRQVQTASAVTSRFIELRSAFRCENQTEALQGNHSAAATDE
jgi:hypothetical protein